MSDHRFELHPSRSHQPDGVLQVSQSADVRKEVTQAAFAEKVDVNRKGLTKPGNSDDFSSRPNSIDGLIQRFASGKPLLGTAPGAFKHHVCPIALRQLTNGSHRIIPFG